MEICFVVFQSTLLLSIYRYQVHLMYRLAGNFGIVAILRPFSVLLCNLVGFNRLQLMDLLPYHLKVLRSSTC